ncbi:MAG: hypothetical protein A3G75_06960 [Verrucomicrobia bacterium RIFCSPLOWO2_12_FULL_64_8]|nr:MAG: hypothetical protein A3G75_06960 [Verrucomicrobia bacterium RIFCSPLOWO2_12_FULL_64_8]
MPPPDECAQCGAIIPRGAMACPECGADERTGWREVSVHDGLDLPEPAYEDAATPPKSRDFGYVHARGAGPKWYWVVGGLLALVLFVMSVLGLKFW